MANSPGAVEIRPRNLQIDHDLRKRLVKDEVKPPKALILGETDVDKGKLTACLESEEAKMVDDPDRSRWIPYKVLFSLTGVDENKGVMAIPFLESDDIYNLPDFRKKIRFNFVYRNILPGSEKQMRDNRPEVPLVVADMTEGFALRDQTVDFLVLNHGVLMTMLSFESTDKVPRTKNQYFDDVKRVIKPGGLIMMYDYNDEVIKGHERPENVAEELGAEILDFKLSPEVLARISKDSGRDNIERFEDLFSEVNGFYIKPVFLKMPESESSEIASEPQKNGQNL